MDSGNSSGSMYSSGGDEEYDSRGESISALLNSNPNPSHLGYGSMPRHHQPQPPQMATLHSPTPSMFDPLSNFFDPLTTRSASLAAVSSPILNLDMAAWYKSPRPDQSTTDLSGFGLVPMQLQPLLGYNNQGQSQGSVAAGATSFPVPSEPEGLRQLGSISGSTPNEQAPVTASNTTTNNNGAPGNTLSRNPKKRSRASRRAPTTVLTTDTTNFRAMVQEFTGIPAPPFTASPFQRSRLDLFGSASGAPSYLLRPFAQKLQPSPVLPSFGLPASSASSNSSSSAFPPSIIDAVASTTAGNSITNTELGLLRPPPSFLNQNMPNPVLDFQSLFQAPGQKYPTASSSIFPAKTLGSSGDIQGSDPNAHLKIRVLEEFGLGHGQLSPQLQPRLPNLQPSDKTLSGDNKNNDNDKNDNPHPDWHGDGAGSSNGSNQGTLRPIEGNFGHVGNSDKGPRKASARGEGMVESWICSSD